MVTSKYQPVAHRVSSPHTQREPGLDERVSRAQAPGHGGDWRHVSVCQGMGCK